ncbi:hypothetical protein SCG7086_BJ_00070 [Chlamydiales bacterium SCGC AG-110-P3]|nr:hypothetical protein SCG7086_BJ_00070 [Chlamydiales bacterium SCGC AG-110-P3]
MKLAISNIAWNKPEDEKVAEVLQGLGVKGIEVAPSKIWLTPVEVSETEVKAYRAWWESRGISIIGMQALLFNKPALTLFESKQRRQNTFDYLSQLIRLAGQLGVEAMVFGSPKNRKIGSVGQSQAHIIAEDFFGRLGEVALTYNTKFCIEPNPSNYGCDFLTSISEAIALIRKVNHPGFRLHLDSGGMILNGEAIPSPTFLSVDEVAHFHVSEPFLLRPEKHPESHQQYAAALNDMGYRGWVSIEMKPSEDSLITDYITNAIKNVNEWYQQ